jgi:hypothetical protein
VYWQVLTVWQQRRKWVRQNFIFFNMGLKLLQFLGMKRHLHADHLISVSLLTHNLSTVSLLTPPLCALQA